MGGDGPWLLWVKNVYKMDFREFYLNVLIFYNLNNYEAQAKYTERHFVYI